jgi:uncharacterized membrane protein
LLPISSTGFVLGRGSTDTLFSGAWTGRPFAFFAASSSSISNLGRQIAPIENGYRLDWTSERAARWDILSRLPDSLLGFSQTIWRIIGITAFIMNVGAVTHPPAGRDRVGFYGALGGLYRRALVFKQRRILAGLLHSFLLSAKKLQRGELFRKMPRDRAANAHRDPTHFEHVER